MIPEAYLTEWAATAPWPDSSQIEQDLILSRLIAEFANHPLLGKELAFRGGTCLHKLYLPSAYRYSEDLDYVRIPAQGGVGQYFDAIRALAAEIGLAEGRRAAQSGSMATMFLNATPELGGANIRIKIEINMDEGDSLFGIVKRDYAVESRWWSGQAEVPTYRAEELLGTKFRALYQRDKGRDLFDLWLGLTELTQEYDAIIATLDHHMGDRVFSYRQFVRNIDAKLAKRDFSADLEALVTLIPDEFTDVGAVELVKRELAMRLRNAPGE